MIYYFKKYHVGDCFDASHIKLTKFRKQAHSTAKMVFWHCCIKKARQERKSSSRDVFVSFDSFSDTDSSVSSFESSEASWPSSVEWNETIKSVETCETVDDYMSTHSSVSMVDFPFEIITGARRRVHFSLDELALLGNEQFLQAGENNVKVAVNRCLHLEKIKDDMKQLKDFAHDSQESNGFRNPRTGQVLLYVGGCHFRKNSLRAAELSFREASLCVEGKHPEVEAEFVIGEAFANLGMLYWSLEEHVKSVDYLQMSLKWHSVNKEKDGRSAAASICVAHCLQKLGLVYKAMGRYHDASDVLGKSVLAHNQVATGWYELASVLDDMGLVELRAGDNKQALALHKTALEVKYEAITRNDSSKLKEMAELFATRANFERAELLLLLSFGELSLVSTIIHLAKAHAATEDFTSAAYRYESAIRIIRPVWVRFVKFGTQYASLTSRMAFDMAGLWCAHADAMEHQGFLSISKGSWKKAEELYVLAGST